MNHKDNRNIPKLNNKIRLTISKKQALAISENFKQHKKNIAKELS